VAKAYLIYVLYALRTVSYKTYSLSTTFQVCYLTALGGGQTVGDSVRRMLRNIGTNVLWCGFNLKGKKSKTTFIDLPITRIINS